MSHLVRQYHSILVQIEDEMLEDSIERAQRLRRIVWSIGGSHVLVSAEDVVVGSAH
jgi:hypothetical protein